MLPLITIAQKPIFGEEFSQAVSIWSQLRLNNMSIIPDKAVRTSYIQEEGKSQPGWIVGQIIISLFNGLVPFIIATILPIPQWAAFTVWGIASVATFVLLCIARNCACANEYELHDN